MEHEDEDQHHHTTNLEEFERKLSSAAHDDVFADASDELSRP